MDNIIILSDDLTGANDSGVQFAKRGIPTVVCIDDKQTIDPDVSGIAVVINVESRSLLPDEAYSKWTQLLSTIEFSKFQVIMKKIDSTLRGNIGKEIEAMLDSGKFDLAVVAPAYPQKARWTVGGYQLLHDQLLEDSEISRDPKFPVTNSQISALIHEQTSLPVGEVGIRAVRSGKLEEQLNLLLQQGKRIVVADSATDGDLAIIAALFSQAQTQMRVLWVGSAGLAEALANRYPLLGFLPTPPSQRPVPVQAAPQSDRSAPLGQPAPAKSEQAAAPVLVAAGSVSQTTRLQVETLKQHGFRTLVIDPLLLLGTSAEEMAELTQEARQMIASGEDLVLTTDISQAAKSQVAEYLQKAGLSVMQGGDQIADGIGRLAAAIITNEALAGAVLTGGDIAYSTCTHLNIARLRIIGEVEEGLPLCVAEGSLSVPLVTKAGAFGNPNSLLHAAQAIKLKRSQL
ncbi:four-carbon acid sugar kinase family protein [Paenibacillus agricola]|uniref:Four-carbon acid sugar kinase family protein n=1 Tax=Paenibacillus agricola TaxID=2716264 RepID=A0ABX0IYB4_9BACL|nr:four-carbon acid sugar kinase family protein [Paenibacillus agricola]NHN28949.1 four-carbon acid sugar kinase family protein [Paenibacillus agricola]